MPGTLYIVSTPIGNLDDITLRAISVLKDVDLIAAEDTRHTHILLRHHGIHTTLTSYHEHNEKAKASQLVERLIQGEDIALVSDAGTPTVSDPGYRLIKQAAQAGVRISPVPGPSAALAALAASGLPTNRFVFEGFLPAKRKERRERLQTLSREPRTLIFFEAPHRLKESLSDIVEILGDREAAVGREITKVYEEFLRGLLSKIVQQVATEELRGEITLVLNGSAGEPVPSQEALEQEIRRLQAEGMRIKEIAELLGEKYGYSKKQLYRLALEQK